MLCGGFRPDIRYWDLNPVRPASLRAHKAGVTVRAKDDYVVTFACPQTQNETKTFPPLTA
jgi:hypothetical protein